jgi:hypothetical protein
MVGKIEEREKKKKKKKKKRRMVSNVAAGHFDCEPRYYQAKDIYTEYQLKRVTCCLCELVGPRRS